MLEGTQWISGNTIDKKLMDDSKLVHRNNGAHRGEEGENKRKKIGSVDAKVRGEKSH